MTSYFSSNVGQYSVGPRLECAVGTRKRPSGYCGASFSIYAPAGRSQSQKLAEFLESLRGLLGPLAPDLLQRKGISDELARSFSCARLGSVLAVGERVDRP